MSLLTAGCSPHSFLSGRFLGTIHPRQGAGAWELVPKVAVDNKAECFSALNSIMAGLILGLIGEAQPATRRPSALVLRGGGWEGKRVCLGLPAMRDNYSACQNKMWRWRPVPSSQLFRSPGNPWFN